MVQIVDRWTKIIWRSWKWPIITIPRMQQFPNAVAAATFSGNAHVTCSTAETPLRVKRVDEGGATKGNPLVRVGWRTCSPFVTNSALSTSRKYAANIIARRRQAMFDGLMQPRDIKVLIACKKVGTRCNFTSDAMRNASVVLFLQISSFSLLLDRTSSLLS